MRCGDDHTAPAGLSRGRFLALVLAAALLVPPVLTGCATLGPEPPRVSLIGLKSTGGTAFEQRFVATLRLNNPNDMALSIAGYALDLEMADARIATATSDRRLSLPALGEMVVEAPFRASTLGMLNGLRALLAGGDVEAAVDGVVYADTPLGRIGLPIREIARLD